jgi:hypothetical protein
MDCKGEMNCSACYIFLFVCMCIKRSLHNTHIYVDIHTCIQTYIVHIYLAYYVEFKTHLFSHFFQLKIRLRLKCEVLFFTLRKPRKHHFPRRTSSAAARIVNFTDSGMYMLAQFFFLKSTFLKLECVLN